jgi:small subunit ribosomal protein S3
MGQKVHPLGFRLGVTKSWDAIWYASPKEYTDLLHQDLAIRKLIQDKLGNAGISTVVIERSGSNQVSVTIHTSRPGIVIGRQGTNVDQLREEIEKRFGVRVKLSIQEVKHPELDATLVAQSVAAQIEKRISHKRAMKQAIARAMRAGAQGIKIAVSGRLRGSEMARREWDREGRVPLQTLVADIDFGKATAFTTTGTIGVKVWIYKGDINLGQGAPASTVGARIEDSTLPDGSQEVLESHESESGHQPAGTAAGTRVSTRRKRSTRTRAEERGSTEVMNDVNA